MGGTVSSRLVVTASAAGPTYDYLGLSADSTLVAISDWTTLTDAAIWGGAAPAGIVAPTSTTLYGATTSDDRTIGVEGIDDGATNTFGLMQAVAAGPGTWTIRVSLDRTYAHGWSISLGHLGMLFLDTAGQNMSGAGVNIITATNETNVAASMEFTTWSGSSDGNNDPTGTWTAHGQLAGVGIVGCDIVITLTRDGADNWFAYSCPYGQVPQVSTNLVSQRNLAGAGWIGVVMQENAGTPSRPWFFLRSQLLATGATLPHRQTP